MLHAHTGIQPYGLLCLDHCPPHGSITMSNDLVQQQRYGAARLTAKMRARLLPSTAYTPLSASALACTWHRYSASTRRGSASSTARLQAAATAPITWQASKAQQWQQQCAHVSTVPVSQVTAQLTSESVACSSVNQWPAHQ
jgi:hypothetical protein